VKKLRTSITFISSPAAWGTDEAFNDRARWMDHFSPWHDFIQANGNDL
jgi:hypothetical protein